MQIKDQIKHSASAIIIFNIIFTLLLIFPSKINGQKNSRAPVKAVNNYIQYTNESIHGLLIIHRLLELYNQELNKYVDLPHYQLNLFSNSDFPENIFKDKSGAYYRIAPAQLYEIAVAESKYLPADAAKKCNNIISEMQEITDQLEKDRYSIGTLVENTDKSHLANLTNIYNALDACVIKYDAFEAKRKELDAVIRNIKLQNSPSNNLTKLIVPTYNKYALQLHQTFDVLRTENTANSVSDAQKLLPILDELNNSISKFSINNQDPMQKIVIKDIEKSIGKQKTELTLFIKNPIAPESFVLYGPCYYFYNTQLAGATNKYGTGTVERLNELIVLNGNTTLFQFERPHYFKVIRPKRVIEDTDSANIVLPIDKIETERKLYADRGKQITSPNQNMLIEVYDHEEFDHDTISLNFNGKWILKNQLITKDPIRLYLPLIKGKENYLILHAENLGERPPNTCAIRYQTKNGKYDTVILHSDFNQSGVIKIRYD